MFETINNKFKNVNVRVVLDENAPGLIDKHLFLHNGQKIEGGITGVDNLDALGATLNFGDVSVAEVNINNIVDQVGSVAELGPVDFSQAVGSVCTHEMGHIFLPDGHSISNQSIMGNGSDVIPELFNGADHLAFTPLQEDLMNATIANQGDVEFMSLMDRMDLGEVEETANLVASIPDIAAESGVAELALADIDSIQQLDPSLWGGFDPSTMDSVSSLGDLSEFGELASNFDLGILTDAGAEGATIIFGDLDGLENLADAGSEGISSLFSDVDGDGIIDIAGELFDKIGEILSFLPF